MYTLFDFITHIKGIEYIIAILFIVGYILYVEALKPRPFATLIRALRETRDQMRKLGYWRVIGTIAKIFAMPVIGLAYVIALPFFFVFAACAAVTAKLSSNTGRGLSFGWRPTVAYLGGKKDAPIDLAERDAAQKTTANP